jgi:hypothetical protein
MGLCFFLLDDTAVKTSHRNKLNVFILPSAQEEKNVKNMIGQLLPEIWSSKRSTPIKPNTFSGTENI